MEARLLANFEFDTNGWGCWLWTGGVNEKGYGRLRVKGKLYRAHRAAWKTWRGPLTGPLVCHYCDTPACIRPDHLFQGTAQANTDDMIRKGRYRPGNGNNQWTKHRPTKHRPA
jgi:HNH endonuclease